MRPIDADALIEDLEYDIELDQRALDDDIDHSHREITQFDKDCKQNAVYMLRKAPTVEAIPIDWIEEWCLSQDLEYVRIAIKKMMDNWKAERKEK